VYARAGLAQTRLHPCMGGREFRVCRALGVEWLVLPHSAQPAGCGNAILILGGRNGQGHPTAQAASPVFSFPPLHPPVNQPNSTPNKQASTAGAAGPCAQATALAFAAIRMQAVQGRGRMRTNCTLDCTEALHVCPKCKLLPSPCGPMYAFCPRFCADGTHSP